MADTAKQPSILDAITNGTYDPLGVSQVPAPLLSALGTPSPAVPTPKGPSLGTNDELQSPAKEAAGAADGGTLSADGSTLTLPARSRQNSSEPIEESANDHPGFLKTLGRLAGGAVGISDPNSSPQASLGSKIGGLIGRTGASLALAAGTPEQKQLAEEQLQVPLKTAQLQAEINYRNGMLGVKNDANQNTANKTDLQYGPDGTARETADAASQNADSNQALRAAHVKQIEASLNGKVHVMPQVAKMIGRDDLADQDISPIRYQQEVANVLKQVAPGKTVDLGEDGVYGYSSVLGRTARLGDSPSVARSSSMLLRTQLPVNDGQGNTLGWVNPQTKSITSVADIMGKSGGPSLAQMEGGGSVIPPKPTSSMMTQGQMAQTIQPMIPKIQDEVTALADKIGSVGGRWNDFWVNKSGVNDPAYAGLNQDLQLFATALGKAHFGASMPEGFVKDMMRDFGTAQSPEDLQSRLQHAEGWVNGYAARVGGSMPNAPALKKGTNALNSSTLASDNVVEYERGKDGKLHPKGQ